MFIDVGFHLKSGIQEIIVFTDVDFHLNSGFMKILYTPIFSLLDIGPILFQIIKQELAQRCETHLST